MSLKPFHEAVIEALSEADENKLREIAWWLMRVTLPHDSHVKVREAWSNRCLAIGFNDPTLIHEVNTLLFYCEGVTAALRRIPTMQQIRRTQIRPGRR